MRSDQVLNLLVLSLTLKVVEVEAVEGLGVAAEEVEDLHREKLMHMSLLWAWQFQLKDEAEVGLQLIEEDLQQTFQELLHLLSKSTCI